LPRTELSGTARQRLNIPRRAILYRHRRNGADPKHLQRIHLRASLMPAVAVTSAQGAYAYIVALKGFSVGCQPNFKSERNWKDFPSGANPTGPPSEFVFLPTSLNHPSASAEVDLGRALRYKTESTTVICAFFSTRPAQCLQADSFGLLVIGLMRISLD